MIFCNSVTCDRSAADVRKSSVHSTESTWEGKSMAEVMAEVEAASALSPADMTPEAYREYITDRISSLPVHASQDNVSFAVHISDEGLLAMQSDPEYEEWVIDTLRYDFAYEDMWAPLCGGAYDVHSFGAAKEDYHGESWYPGYQNGKGKTLFYSLSQDATWSRYRSTSKASSAKADEWSKLAAKLRLERMLQKMAREHHEVQSELLAHASQHRAMIEQMNRSGRKAAVDSAPLPLFHGVPAAYLLAMLGGSGGGL